jgi:hypothetical protein
MVSLGENRWIAMVPFDWTAKPNDWANKAIPLPDQEQQVRAMIGFVSSNELARLWARQSGNNPDGIMI